MVQYFQTVMRDYQTMNPYLIFAQRTLYKQGKMDILGMSIDHRQMVLKLHAIYAQNGFTLSYTVVPSKGADVS